MVGDQKSIFISIPKNCYLRRTTSTFIYRLTLSSSERPHVNTSLGNQERIFSRYCIFLHAYLPQMRTLPYPTVRQPPKRFLHAVFWSVYVGYLLVVHGGLLCVCAIFHYPPSHSVKNTPNGVVGVRMHSFLNPPSIFS